MTGNINVIAPSVPYSGNTTFALDRNRTYFFIVMTSGSGTIEFAQGGGLIPLAEGAHYNPPVGQASRIDIVTTGSFIVHSNSHETV